jgi:hypothetical protein
MFCALHDGQSATRMMAQYTGWLVALAAAGAMVSFGMELGMLSRPKLRTRCGACGRLVRRGRVCPCSKNDG